MNGYPESSAVGRVNKKSDQGRVHKLQAEHFGDKSSFLFRHGCLHEFTCTIVKAFKETRRNQKSV